MTGRLSIRARLTAAFAAALLLVLALAAVFVYLRVSGELTNTLDNGLRTRADDLAAVAQSSGAGPPDLSSQRLVEGDEGFSQILSADGEVIASTLAPGAGPALDPTEIDSAAQGPVVTEREVPGIDGGARVLGRTVSADDGTLIVVAGAALEEREEALAGLAGAFLIGAPAALALASLIGYLLARRSLAPVDAMRRRAQEITLEQSGERLPLPSTEDEIHQLGETLNEMLDRLETALERERVFVADAAHELRTPLANLRAELELADRSQRTADELRDALRSAAEEAERLSRLAEDLLVIARSDRGRLPIRREPVELSAVLERVGSRFERRAAETGRRIVVDAPAGQSAELDPYRVEQALGNLVDNALRHGEGEVRMAARRDDGRVVLDVSDRGTGFEPGFEHEAFERFTRADEGRSGGGPGLGLAIVRAIAEAHGGRVELVRPSTDSTTTLRLTLPAEGTTND